MIRRGQHPFGRALARILRDIAQPCYSVPSSPSAPKSRPARSPVWWPRRQQGSQPGDGR